MGDTDVDLMCLESVFSSVLSYLFSPVELSATSGLVMSALSSSLSLISVISSIEGVVDVDCCN